MPKFLLALLTFLAVPVAAGPFDAPMPDDPVAEIEGRWYSPQFDLAVDVEDGVVTVSDMKSSHATPVSYQLRNDLVIARIDGGKVLHNRGIQLEGASWQRGGGSPDFRVQQGCSCSLNRGLSNGKLVWTLNVAGLALQRREAIADSLFSARK